MLLAMFVYMKILVALGLKLGKISMVKLQVIIVAIQFHYLQMEILLQLELILIMEMVMMLDMYVFMRLLFLVVLIH